MNKIKVFIKYPHRAPYSARIANKLESLQKIVGGYIETVTLDKDMVIICNEEGRLNGLQRNCKVCGIEFVGPIIFAGVTGEEFASVPMGFEDFHELLPSLWPAKRKTDSDKISLRKTAQLMAEMFGVKPCALANVHKGVARRLPLRCEFTPERCDERSAAEFWAWLLQHQIPAGSSEGKEADHGKM